MPTQTASFSKKLPKILLHNTYPGSIFDSETPPRYMTPSTQKTSERERQKRETDRQTDRQRGRLTETDREREIVTLREARCSSAVKTLPLMSIWFMRRKAMISMFVKSLSTT